MPENMESLTMKMAQVGQIIDQYRVEIYNSELRMNLMIKILEEKGIMVKDEFTKRMLSSIFFLHGASSEAL